MIHPQAHIRTRVATETVHIKLDQGSSSLQALNLLIQEHLVRIEKSLILQIYLGIPLKPFFSRICLPYPCRAIEQVPYTRMSFPCCLVDLHDINVSSFCRLPRQKLCPRMTHHFGYSLNVPVQSEGGFVQSPCRSTSVSHVSLNEAAQFFVSAPRNGTDVTSSGLRTQGALETQ